MDAKKYYQIIMSYIRKAVSDQEKLIALIHPHWIYLATGFFWSVFFILLGIFLDGYLNTFFDQSHLNFIIDFKTHYSYGFLTPVTIVFFIITFFVFWPYFSTYVSSEIGLTTERIILKSGLILVKIDEVDLQDIGAEHVYHGLLGWLLKYGKIKLDCRFVKDVSILAIANPYGFVKASHKARLMHPKIHYNEGAYFENINSIELKEKDNYSQAVIEKLKISFKNSFSNSSKNRTSRGK
ncbi:MAG: hypothetical protein GW749_07960 [Alphaproteobacteria bacterium]|nr:hypothetical protein [Alphaproteobacteria bacterium]NCT07809.1 hypothetical protein [Alphaproteobacteria bacterium]